ncbi:hypothetical protein Tco_0652583 [Tanacetum coccineum]|uniref:Uncharacterized protein n=1 Tax=Tanacetum coccineum TaxID=301880 RepID=A0ABQ4WY29_9ASTR
MKEVHDWLLMYLTASRPDIMFAVCACSRFQVTPKSSHLSVVKRIFRIVTTTGANLDRKSKKPGWLSIFFGRRSFLGMQKAITIVATLLQESRILLRSSTWFSHIWRSSETKTECRVFSRLLIFSSEVPFFYALTVVLLYLLLDEQFWSLLRMIFFLMMCWDRILPNQAIFDAIQLMSSKSTSWDQIPTNIATAVICLTSNQKYNFSKLIFDGMVRHLDAKKKFVMYPRFISIFLGECHPLCLYVLVQPTQDEGASSERPSEAQPTPSPAPTSEVPHEPQTDSSPAHTSEVPLEQQTDPSPRPSPTTTIPDSIPETSGGNLGGHSSSDKSLSGNEGEMTLQSVYDLCLSLCAQVTDQAKEIQNLKAQIKKLKKQAKPVIHHHRAWLKSSLKHRLTRKSFPKKQRVHKESFGGTEEHIEGTEDQLEEGSATQATQTPTSTIFRDDETIAKVLLNMSQAKAVSREKEKGVELKDIEEADKPRPTLQDQLPDFNASSQRLIQKTRKKKI